MEAHTTEASDGEDEDGDFGKDKGISFSENYSSQNDDPYNRESELF